MNTAQWLLSHVQDFYALYLIEQKVQADIPKTAGHGEWIGFLVNHRSDLGAAAQLVEKIMADRPAPSPTPTPVPGPLKAEDFHAALSAVPVAAHGAFIQWLITNAPALLAEVPHLISEIQAILSVLKPAA